jgi:hypothetical protein
MWIQHMTLDLHDSSLDVDSRAFDDSRLGDDISHWSHLRILAFSKTYRFPEAIDTHVRRSAVEIWLVAKLHDNFAIPSLALVAHGNRPSTAANCFVDGIGIWRFAKLNQFRVNARL